jgi:general secretion pathway protein C
VFRFTQVAHCPVCRVTFCTVAYIRHLRYGITFALRGSIPAGQSRARASLRACAATTLNMRQFVIDRSEIAQTAVVTLVTIAALTLLALVAAYWTWIWFAPLPEPRAPSAADTGTAAASAGALFGSMRRDPNSPAPTGIAIRLLGIVAATEGRRGYAVVQLEAKEILAVLEGEDVAPGIRLAEVGTDHVILERGGIRETLAWPEKSAVTESSPLRPNR